MSPTAQSTIRRALQHLADVQDGVPPRREPSKRAQEIYRRVTVNCEPQKYIARELGVSPSRISQVVSSVRTWLAQGSLPSADPLTRQERRRLEFALDKARHEGLYERSIRDYDLHRANPTATTIRTESKPITSNDANPQTPPTEPRTLNPDLCITKVVTTTRPLLPLVQLLKTAQRSTNELQRLAERDNLPDPQPQNEMPSDGQLYSALNDLLFDFRRRAEADGSVPKSTNIDKLLANFLSAFLGIDQGVGTGFFQLDDSIRHFLKAFLLPTARIYPPVTEPQQLHDELLAQHHACVSSPH